MHFFVDGILIKLLKRRQGATDIGLEDGFLVFGYYDFLQILHITDFNLFAPVPQIRNNKNIAIENHIKLVYPMNTQLLGAKECVRFDHWAIGDFPGKPLLALVLLHFTQAAIQQHSLEALINKITDIISREFISLPEADRPLFALYPSIGIMDAVVVCRSCSYAVVSDVINKLKMQKNLLSSSYKLPAIYMKADAADINAWRTSKADRDTHISLRVNLNPNVTSTTYIDALCNNSTAKEIIEFNDNSFDMYGNSDVLVALDNPASDFAEMYLENAAVLNAPFKDIVSGTRSTIRIRQKKVCNNELSGGSKDSGESPDEFNITNPPDDDKDFFESSKKTALKYYFEKQISHDNIANYRIANGFFSLLDFYFDATFSSHNFDIRNMMDPVLTSLIRNLTNSLILSKERNDKEITQKTNTALEGFRNEFYSVITDFSRSDRHFIEDRWLKHPSVGSSTKLIIAYHEMLSSIVSVFANNENTSHTFLVTSGGVDLVSANGYFEHLSREEEDSGRNSFEHRLIFLNLPEEALFNVSSTLFSIFHEAFHYIGERLRNLRYRFILNAFASAVANFIVRQGYAQPGRFFKDNILLPTEETQKLYSLAWDMKKDKDIEAFISRRLEEEEKKEEEKRAKGSEPKGPISLYSAYWKEHAYRWISKVFTKEKGNEESILNELLAIHTQFFCEKEVKSIIANEQIDMTEVENTYIRVVDMLWGDGERIGNDGFTIEELLENVTDAFYEGFSDLCSASILDCSAMQYVSSFCVGIAGYEFVLPENLASALRIGGIMKVRFDKSDITAADRQEFNRVHNIKETDKGIVNYAKELLGQYGKSEHFSVHFEEYLNMCKDEIDKMIENNEVEVKAIRDIYGLFQSVESDIDMMIYGLLNRWRKTSVYRRPWDNLSIAI